MGGRIRGASGLSSEVQLGAGGSKVKSSADGTVQILESDGSTKGTLDTKDLAISGTATGITKAMVGLSNVSNTAPADLPISTAAQTALDLKAPLADATLTGTTNAANLTVTNAVAAGSGSITGDLTVDTSTLKVDSSNNRVGVGTASPSDLLHASGGNAHVDGGSIKITESAGGSNTVTLTQGSDTKLAIDKALKVTSTGASSIAGALTVTGNILTDGTVDGVDIAAFKTSFDNSKIRQISITHSDAGSATNFGSALASGAFVSRLVVKITEAFDNNVGDLLVGDSADPDGFGSVPAHDLRSVGTQIIFDAPYNNKPLASSIQAQYTLSGSSSAGACTISIQQEAI